MKESSGKEKRNKKVTELTTYTVPFPLNEITENISLTNNNYNKLAENSKKIIIKQALELHSQGKITESTRFYQQFINQGFQDPIMFSNYGLILQGLGKLKEAELFTRRAINLNPSFVNAHYNLGNILRDLSQLEEAENSYRKAINLNPDFAQAHSNLGIILRDRGKLKEAELVTRRAIKLRPDCALTYSNLGTILKDLGEFKEAESCLYKAIKLKPNFADAYYSLSTLKCSEDTSIWQKQLFTESLIKNKSKKDLILIYFARANILHNEKNYKLSAKFLKLANQLKFDLEPYKSDLILDKSKILQIESNKQVIDQKIKKNYPQSIFIVGMPRSGSTLVESILSMNMHVDDLGEINILEESFIEWIKRRKEIALSEIYWKNIKDRTNKLRITTNKWLLNYQYTGIIGKHIINSKVIHCYRNPLDNILSIYRTNFTKGIEYSSSLVDCANIYINQEEVMSTYKKKYRSKIYDLNYDLLVTNPNKEIKSLISWLNWEWNDYYLSPHLNKRSISTASNIQVRLPINSKSVEGWRNYKNLLEPAIRIFSK